MTNNIFLQWWQGDSHEEWLNDFIDQNEAKFIYGKLDFKEKKLVIEHALKNQMATILDKLFILLYASFLFTLYPYYIPIKCKLFKKEWCEKWGFACGKRCHHKKYIIKNQKELTEIWNKRQANEMLENT